MKTGCFVSFESGKKRLEKIPVYISGCYFGNLVAFSKRFLPFFVLNNFHTIQSFRGIVGFFSGCFGLRIYSTLKLMDYMSSTSLVDNLLQHLSFQIFACTEFLIILYTPNFLLEIRVIIKLSSHPWYPLICDFFE